MNSRSRAWRVKLYTVALGALQLLYCACRVDNPGFFSGDEREGQRKDRGEDPEVAGSENPNPPQESSSTNTPASTGDDSDASTSDFGDETSTTSDGPLAKVDEPCSKGAAFCYDFRDRVADLAPNLSGVNAGTRLRVSAPADNLSTDSPVFGSRIRLTEESSVVSSQAFPFESKGAIGVDVWFSTKFESTSSMMLFVLDDLLTLEIRSNGISLCKLFLEPGRVVSSKEVRPRTIKPWSHASCLVQTGVELSTDQKTGALMASAGDGFAKIGFPDQELLARPAVLKIGTGGSPLPSDSDIASFEGDLYLVRVWNDAEAMQHHIREELRHFGLDPAN